LLRQLFTIEASGWKGRQGSAVLNAPDVWDFFLAQAQQLAADGELNLVVLEHSGRPIAFEYGWQANGVYFSPKVSYDEAYSAFAPGQLLRAMWLERITHDPRIEVVDFLGAACPATASWATDEYPMERVLISAGGPGASTLIELYRRAGPAFRAARRWLGYSTAPTHRQEGTDAILDERDEAEEPSGVVV
jgi:CelD/BcsL family acetyltransferase involved in cellulose biosynthesis